MKGNDTLVAVGLLLVIVLAWVFASTAEAKSEVISAKQNNAVMKACLQEHGYTPERFEYFDFTKAADCFHEWKTAEREKNYAEMRKFLKERPWYKGPNWKWEETAEYECEKIYSTALLNTITVCSKPYYIN